MTHTLIIGNSHDEALAKSHTLIFQDGLKRQLDAFLLAGRCEDLSPRTIEDYSGKIGRALAYLSALGVKEVGEVTATHLRGFLMAIQPTMKPVSVHCYYRCVKRFFNWLVSEGEIVSSPVKAIRPPKVEKKIIRPFNVDEIKRMLVVCEGRGILTLRDRAIILVFCDTGIRVSEMAGIQMDDLNISKMQIRVLGKGRKERVVGVSPRTMMAVGKYVAARRDNCPYLFVSYVASPLTSKGIYNAVVELGRRAELTETRNSPHTFRHTFVTMSIRNGASVFDIQSILGHATLTMTRRYSASIQSENAAEAQKRFSPVNHLKL